MSGNAKSAKAGVKGRTLDEFVKERPLSPAEKDVLKACANGEIAELGAKRPKTKTEDKSIRAGLIRLLALGCDPKSAPVHEKGVRVAGAWIDGDLDLENCRVPFEIALSSCTIPGKLVLRDADCFSLDLRGSEVAEISAQRVHCTTLVLSAGFHATRTVDLGHGRIDGTLYCDGGKFSAGVRLDGACIGGDFDCSGGCFDGAGGAALSCAGIKIGGFAFLKNGFQANGGVFLHGADIGGDFDCSGGCFDGAGGAALSCPGIKIGGFAFLKNGFQANGEVLLPGADIGLNLECMGGKFKGLGGTALQCSVAKIGGSVYLNEHVTNAGEQDEKKKNQFRALGLVRFDEANISGNLFCGGGLFVGWKTKKDGKVKRGTALRPRLVAAYLCGRP